MKVVLLVASLGTLASCGSVAPLPDDVFLRPALPTTEVRASGAQGWTNGELRVAPVKAAGLYHERAIAYSDDDGASLRQHRYLFWLEPPEEIVRQSLIEHLRASGVAPQVVSQSSTAVSLEVVATIKRFEQLVSAEGRAMQAEVGFQIRTLPDGESVFNQSYRAREVCTEATAAASALAMGRALDGVFTQFEHTANAVLQARFAKE
ncbi:MAG: ABC-type transport auxiliary lipoprotein family protein [Gammaproteobacteria bacterium]